MMIRRCNRNRKAWKPGTNTSYILSISSVSIAIVKKKILKHFQSLTSNAMSFFLQACKFQFNTCIEDELLHNNHVEP